MSGNAQHWGQKSEHPSHNSAAWMLTFADLLSLILTFFVMIYATSSMIEPKWQKVTSSLAHRLNPNKVVRDEILTTNKSISIVDVKEAVDVSYLYSLVSEKIKSQKELSVLQLGLQEGIVVLSLPDDVLFQDENTLSPKAEQMMALLEDIFYQIGNQVDVYSYEGVAQQPSGWTQALTRAVTVAQGLQKFGYTYEIQVFGLPEDAYQENIIVNIKESKKALYAPSRRVDIVIRNEKAVGTP